MITPIACAVPGAASGAPKLSGVLEVRLAPGSLAHEVYGRLVIEEEFYCNYELNPAFQPQLASGGLRITGLGAGGEARVIERPAHPFFLATNFLPQVHSAPGRPHPVIEAYLRACAEWGRKRQTNAQTSSQPRQSTTVSR